MGAENEPIMNEEIFNAALEMSLEWGENFHKPMDRVRAAYPAVTQAEADELNKVCRELTSYAFEQIELAYLKKIPDAEVGANVRARYPLVNADSMARLWSQGQYYAWHDNG